MKMRKSLLLGLVTCSVLFAACGKGDASQDKVIIYTNADDEPVQVMQKVLDDNGFKDQYTLQTFGTSDLGSKLLAEGTNIEADLVTMSTFYLKSAQESKQMFQPLETNLKPLVADVDFAAPFSVQEGAIFYNTDALAEANVPVPASLKDLADPKYANLISISDIKQSSTAWLLFQALIDAYGKEEARDILTKIYENAGDHFESSGSAPLKKVRLGEVPIGFGLRHQAVLDKENGEPIGYVEGTEGTYTLTESFAVVDKGDKTNPKAQEMLNVILEKGRTDLIEIYPSPIYEGETANSAHAATNQKVFPAELTAELLKEHQELMDGVN
ncbi:extracellular solute-binding protein [Enterococcus alcedinis]|uniref:2-aminoethylphosphonate ABC transporter substrate-binding protein n=1 Tax=Enterococcus alcedinis TaxID=1274384 RepID=A0A917JDJ6_9ENTE|nr:extracellular solute-binding protein [Enterococcus alcedinis]MBP2101365.1 ABC-type Fe3+ transport system substrate-binding protein [Enterococcus alcedinis]GGI65243.1 putative 2-aminoethylphosphonate ABC transporter substrate-binding protein [Enterococcus alcedinis]